LVISKKVRVHLALFAVALFYAGNFSFAKWAMPQFISPYAFILLRVGAGMVFFLGYSLFFSKERIRHKKDYLQLAIASFFGVAFNMTAFFKGLSMTSSINASVLMLMAPVFVVIFSAIGYKKRIQPVVYLGIFIAFVGAALLVDVFNFSWNNQGFWGDILVMLNAISYAFYLYYVTRLLNKYNALTITTFLFVFGFLMVLPIGLPDFMEVSWHTLPYLAIFAMVYVIVGITILAYILNAWALQNSHSTTVGSYIYLQPLLATLIAIAWGMDTLSLEKVGCGLLIISGLFLVNKGRN
jgi:drug/metabolite transporter (DMT)-like permease